MVLTLLKEKPKVCTMTCPGRYKSCDQRGVCITAGPGGNNTIQSMRLGVTLVVPIGASVISLLSWLPQLITTSCGASRRPGSSARCPST